MSLETDRQLKRILILLGLGFLALCSTLYPVAKDAYRYVTSGQGGQIIKDISNVRKTLITKYDHKEIGLTGNAKGGLYTVFVNSRFANLPESLRLAKANDIANTMKTVYSKPEELNEIKIIFLKYERRFMRPALKDSSATYSYHKIEQGTWVLEESLPPIKAVKEQK